MQLAQARLHDSMCQQTVAEGNDMPAKDYRTLGEDLVNVAVRLPQSVLDQVDTHITTLRTMSPWARVGRSEALRDVILRGIASLAPQAPPAPVPLAPDRPPVPPDQPPLPLVTARPQRAPEPHTVFPAVEAEPPKASAVHTQKTPLAEARARALDLRQQHKGYGKIADVLNEEGFPTSSGKGKWGGQTVKDVLLTADANQAEQ